DGQRPGRDDFVVDVDLVEHRKAHDAGSMLADRAAPEARRIEYEAMTEIESMLDRRLQPVEIRNRFFQPAKRLAQPRVDFLEALDVGVLMRRLSRRLVLYAQFVEQRSLLRHR